MSQFTSRTHTNIHRVPRNHTTIKLSAPTISNIFHILTGVESLVDDEPETVKKLKIYGNILGAGDDDQTKKILINHMRNISDLIVGTIGQFTEDNLRNLMYEGMNQAEEEVGKSIIKESQYKLFCDTAKGMLEVLQAIDAYNSKTDGIYDLSYSSKITKYNDINVLQLAIYTPIPGTF